MCGIVGLVKLKDSFRVNREILCNMIKVLSHRGPDNISCKIIEKDVGLSHARLKIVDLSENANQPMVNEFGTIWLIANGEIYNYKELRKELESRGHRFISNSDNEVIIHLYEEYGIKLLDKLDGMFAFSIVDTVNKKVFVARDIYGIKSLFYKSNDNYFGFASEIKSLYQIVDNTKVDIDSLSYFLTFNYIPAPYTLFEGIKELLPGHYIKIKYDTREVSINRYYKLNLKKRERRYFKDKQEVFNHFEFLLNNAVKKRLMSDVDFGVFLSGGLDSSTISYFMRNNIGDKIKAYSVGFEDDSYDEVEDARIVSEHLSLDHKIFTVKNNFPVEDVIKLIWYADKPIGDSSIIPFYYVSQKASQEVKMVLSGDGGDEVLAGYETYQAYYLHKFYRKVPDFLKERVVLPFVSSLKPKFKRLTFEQKIKRFVSFAKFDWRKSHILWRSIFTEEEKKKVLKEDVVKKITDISGTDYPLTFFPEENSLNSLLEFDFCFYLPNDMLYKVDSASMANSLEVRVPFLDKELVEFLFSLPPKYKLKNLCGKKV